MVVGAQQGSVLEIWDLHTCKILGRSLFFIKLCSPASDKQTYESTLTQIMMIICKKLRKRQSFLAYISEIYRKFY